MGELSDKEKAAMAVGLALGAFGTFAALVKAVLDQAPKGEDS